MHERHAKDLASLIFMALDVLDCVTFVGITCALCVGYCYVWYKACLILVRLVYIYINWTLLRLRIRWSLWKQTRRETGMGRPKPIQTRIAPIQSTISTSWSIAGLLWLAVCASR
jgi:hypothetical protein